MHGASGDIDRARTINPDMFVQQIQPFDLVSQRTDAVVRVRENVRGLRQGVRFFEVHDEPNLTGLYGTSRRSGEDLTGSTWSGGYGQSLEARIGRAVRRRRRQHPTITAPS